MAEKYIPQCTICLQPVDLEKERIIDTMSIVMTTKPDLVTHRHCEEERQNQKLTQRARTTH